MQASCCARVTRATRRTTDVMGRRSKRRIAAGERGIAHYMQRSEVNPATSESYDSRVRITDRGYPVA